MYAPHVHEMTREEAAINREQQARVLYWRVQEREAARQRHEFKATQHRAAYPPKSAGSDEHRGRDADRYAMRG